MCPDGHIIARLNISTTGRPSDDSKVECSSDETKITHGLWRIKPFDAWSSTFPSLPSLVNVLPGPQHLVSDIDTFIFDPQNLDTITVAFRPNDARSDLFTTTNKIYSVCGSSVETIVDPIKCEMKGVFTPLACVGSSLFFSFSSPSEWGDLYVYNRGQQSTQRLTHTMPLSTKAKLSAPQEIIITNPRDGTQIPTLIYYPSSIPASATSTSSVDLLSLPSLVWVRGGPMAFSRYDYTPHLNWYVFDYCEKMFFTYFSLVSHFQTSKQIPAISLNYFNVIFSVGWRTRAILLPFRTTGEAQELVFIT